MESVEPAAAPAGPGAARLLTRRVREMFRVYPKALVGDVEAVHDLRVAARRLRAAVALLVEKPDGRRARRCDRTLAALARAAGRGRDLDVGIEILEALPSGASEANPRLRRALRASRSRARVLSREALLDLDVAHLRRDMRALVAQAQLDRAVLAERLAALRQREEQTIGRELSTGRARPRPEQLHRARRAARRLRYAAEIEDLFDGVDSGAADRWRAMQTRLGEIQDRHVLAAWLSFRERRAAARGDSNLVTAARRALSRVRADAARRTRAFLAPKVAPAEEPPV
jgi:CHAD domain-containing protein